MATSNTKIDMITDDLRNRIQSHSIELGKRGNLPSISELAKEYGATKHIVAQAMETLRAEGIVVSRVGSGLYPAPQDRLRISELTKDLGAYFRQNGIEYVEVNLESPSILPADARLAKIFGVSEGTLVVRRVRSQGSKAERYRFSETYFPYSLIGEQNVLNMQQDATFDALKVIREAHGRVPRRVKEIRRTRLSTAREQAILNIARGTPIIEEQRWSYADDDNATVLMYNEIVVDANKAIFEREYEATSWSEYWQRKAV